MSFIFAFLLLTAKDFASFAESVIYTSALIPNVFFWLDQDYFAPAADYKPLLHLWSLGVEEQFYLLWPLLLIALLRWPKAVVISTLIGLTLSSLALGEYWLTIDPNTSFYLLPLRCFGLTLGALLVFIPPLRSNALILNILLLLGLMSIGFAVAGFDTTTVYPGINALVPVLGAVLALYAGQAPLSRPLLSNRPLSHPRPAATFRYGSD